jgi:long-chain acyl-CoA synthetase
VPATYRFMLSSLEATLASNPVCANDEFVSVINPGWFFAQVLGFGAFLLTGQKLNFPESVETAPEDLREISPDTLLYPSQVWDRIASGIQVNVANGTWLKRMLFNRNLSMGYDVTDLSLGGRRPNIFGRLRHSIAELITFRPLRDKHGLNRARVAYAAGGMASPENLRFFHAVGVNLKQIFGSIEGGIVSTDPGERRID